MKIEIQHKRGPKIISINRRRAIREKCLNCTGWTPSEVTNCEFTDCLLHVYRSGKGKQNAKARAKSIRAYCLWCCCDQRREVKLCPSTDCPLFPYRLTVVARSTEIAPLPQKGHIEPFKRDKIELKYPSKRGRIKTN